MNPEPKKAPKRMHEKTARVMGIPEWFVFCAVFMVAIVSSAFFVKISYIELRGVLDSMHEESQQELTLKFIERNNNILVNAENIHELASVYLELDVIQDRRSRANYLIATRSWLRFMPSAFGSILVFFGAIFLLSRIGSGSWNELRSENGIGGLRFGLITTSPGIIMIAIGAILMAVPHFSGQDISVGEGAIYVNK